MILNLSGSISKEVNTPPDTTETDISVVALPDVNVTVVLPMLLPVTVKEAFPFSSVVCCASTEAILVSADSADTL